MEDECLPPPPSGLSTSLGYTLSLIWAWSLKYTQARPTVTLPAVVEIEYIPVTFGLGGSILTLSQPASQPSGQDCAFAVLKATQAVVQ